MSWNYVLALVTALGLCAVMGPFLIPALQKLHFGQSIRDCGPDSHQKKSGTPTMGGVMIILAVLISTMFWSPLSGEVLIALWLLFGHGVIGFIDDFIKVVLKRNLGLTSLQKIVMQTTLAVVYMFYVGHIGMLDTTLWIPLVNTTIDLGSLYYVLVFLLLVGTTNAVNLTDGLDGLVSWVTVPASLAFAFIAYELGAISLVPFALAITGACLGFLIFNRYPAKVFMGDTGSLALGGGMAALALLTKTELLLVIIGGMYVLEALSVIIQVIYFKFTHGQRIFRMSPLHHHYELGGWRETKVVRVFATVSLVFSLLGVIMFLIK